MRGSPARQGGRQLEPIGERISAPSSQAPRKSLSRPHLLARGVTGIIGELTVHVGKEVTKGPHTRIHGFLSQDLVLDTFAVVVEGKPDLLRQFTGNTTTKLRLCQRLNLW